jgi:hypothetical protein
VFVIAVWLRADRSSVALGRTHTVVLAVVQVNHQPNLFKVFAEDIESGHIRESANPLTEQNVRDLLHQQFWEEEELINQRISLALASYRADRLRSQSGPNWQVIPQ